MPRTIFPEVLFEPEHFNNKCINSFPNFVSPEIFVQEYINFYNNNYEGEGWNLIDEHQLAINWYCEDSIINTMQERIEGSHSVKYEVQTKLKNFLKNLCDDWVEENFDILFGDHIITILEYIFDLITFSNELSDSHKNCIIRGAMYNIDKGINKYIERTYVEMLNRYEPIHEAIEPIFGKDLTSVIEPYIFA